MYAATGVTAKGCDVAVADVSGAIGPTRYPQILKVNAMSNPVNNNTTTTGEKNMFMKTTIATLVVVASVLQPLASMAADTDARPLKDLSQASSQIHWPHGFDPKTADAFVHNEIFIKAPANVIWDNLVKATEWPEWYSNSSDMQIAGGGKTELEADVDFAWKTFGFPIKSTVHEFVPNERLGWFGSGTGIKAYHTWLIVHKDDGCEVITEETQFGPSAIQYNIEQPTAMYDGHHWWLAALKYRSQHATKN